MPEHFVAQREGAQSTDQIDELGILYWKIGVLVIGLRLVIVVPLHPLLLAALAQLVTLLLWSAFVLAIADLLRLLWRVTCWICRGYAERTAAMLRAVWRVWLRGDWLIGMAIDCALAALIVLLAITLAVQERLDWCGAAWVTIMCIIRVVFQERCRRAGAVLAAL
jgi:hypothetical protein